MRARLGRDDHDTGMLLPRSAHRGALVGVALGRVGDLPVAVAQVEVPAVVSGLPQLDLQRAISLFAETDTVRLLCYDANMIKTEGGSGGRKGHSNMTHYDKTAQVKKSARKARRVNDKAATKESSAWR